MQKNTNLPSLHSTLGDFIYMSRRKRKRKKEIPLGRSRVMTATLFWWTEPSTNSSAIMENARKEKEGWKKIRYQATVKEKEKEARTSYKMKINPRQIFISSYKKNILCRKILTCQVFIARSGDFIWIAEKEKERRKYLWGDQGLWQRRHFDEQSPSRILRP